mgnify:CR=1 FL=1|jgi:hypothetical protein
MLGRFLHVQHPTAKQAVITAIDLLGNFLTKKLHIPSCFLESIFHLVEKLIFRHTFVCFPASVCVCFPGKLFPCFVTIGILLFAYCY